MKVLVTGGSGYIGGVTIKQLEAQGWETVNFDLKQGQDLQNKADLKKVFEDKEIKAVIHFAGFISMGESMERPYKYFVNNVFGSLNLFEAMVEAGVDKLIFSSSAGVYGNPERVPIKEEDQKNPTNPYGESKLMVEKLLAWYDRVHKVRSISLRYFNAAGATLDGKMGENHEPETHLIPNLIKAVLKKESFTLFGNDYPTDDGTCVRDYIHVVDLAQAHLLALKALMDGHQSDVYNAGTGKGYSNQEVINMVEKVSSQKVNVKVEPRRPGDADKLIADSTKLQQQLNWQAKHSDLETIITTAWKWHQHLLK